ncbi:MAG: hypothetical protein HKN68_13585 [Saprospiraceae bacterium]|nr:hypothetical protein [Saprospiraceae bacterium]
MRATRTTLKKLEAIFQDLDYTIRYEKGNFNSGYCIVEERRIVVINRFFDTEGRVNSLLDILSQIVVHLELLSESSLDFYNKILKSGFTISNKSATAV